MSKWDLLYLGLVVIYLAVLGWYIVGVIMTKKKREEAKHTAHRRKNLPAENKPDAASSPPADSSRRHSRRRRGKRCPQCKTMIDERRTICQHCGHKFDPIPGLEPHPDEIRMLKKNQPSNQNPSQT